MSFWDKKEAKRSFKKLPFYNTSIQKIYIKCLKNIDLLRQMYVCIKYCKNIKSIQKICRKF